MWQLSTETKTIDLHPQFIWRDEYDWTALAQSEPIYTLTGAMDIQQGTKRAGRPITLDGTKARLNRGQMKALQALSEIPELIMTLTHPDGRAFRVIFARPAIDNIVIIKEYQPSDQSDADRLTANLHFLITENAP